MTPEEKAEKWMKDNTKRYNLDDFTCHKFSRADCIKAYLAGYAEGVEAGRVAESNRQEIGKSLNRPIVRRTDYERCLDKGDTLDYDIEPEHS